MPSSALPSASSESALELPVLTLQDVHAGQSQGLHHCHNLNRRSMALQDEHAAQQRAAFGPAKIILSVPEVEYADALLRKQAAKEAEQELRGYVPSAGMAAEAKPPSADTEQVGGSHWAEQSRATAIQPGQLWKSCMGGARV